MKELLLGCGHSRDRKIFVPGSDKREWENLYTLDNNKTCKPDLLCNIDLETWHISECSLHGQFATDGRGRLKDNFFDEIHAYEVLEHLGRQGEVHSFFSTFYNIYSLLCPFGFLFCSVPSYHSVWLWGDPGHRRVIQPQSLVFLDQTEYAKQLGNTAMSDYRNIWRGDFKPIWGKDNNETFFFILQAIKPARK